MDKCFKGHVKENFKGEFKVGDYEGFSKERDFKACWIWLLGIWNLDFGLGLEHELDNYIRFHGNRFSNRPASVRSCTWTRTMVTQSYGCKNYVWLIRAKNDLSSLKVKYLRWINLYEKYVRYLLLHSYYWYLISPQNDFNANGINVYW